MANFMKNERLFQHYVQQQQQADALAAQQARGLLGGGQAWSNMFAGTYASSGMALANYQQAFMGAPRRTNKKKLLLLPDVRYLSRKGGSNG